MMAAEHRKLRILLVSEDPVRADRIQRLLEQHGLGGILDRVRIGCRAVDQARGRKKFRDAPRYDLVLLDFADAQERYLPAVAEIAFQRRKKQPPVVLLTSAESERLLATGSIGEAAADLFTPLGLFEFLSRAGEHGIKRFLGAVRIIARHGPILVRLPGFVAASARDLDDAKFRRTLAIRVA